MLGFFRNARRRRSIYSIYPAAEVGIFGSCFCGRARRYARFQVGNFRGQQLLFMIAAVETESRLALLELQPPGLPRSVAFRPSPGFSAEPVRTVARRAAARAP